MKRLFYLLFSFSAVLNTNYADDSVLQNQITPKPFLEFDNNDTNKEKIPKEKVSKSDKEINTDFNNEIILHEGQLEISIIDENNEPQRIEELYVSCTDNSNLRAKGKKTIIVNINNCKKTAINALLKNEQRWLVDIWHHENKGLPLVLEKYRLKINGKIFIFDRNYSFLLKRK